MSDRRCEHCQRDPDPRGPSACAACRALNSGDPFRDDRDAQLARAEALATENAQLRQERDALQATLNLRAGPALPKDGPLLAAEHELQAGLRGVSQVRSARMKIRFSFLNLALLKPAATVRGRCASIQASVVKDAEIVLHEGVVKIGRVVSAHLSINHPTVSRMHAIIEGPRLDGVILMDLGSVFGTFLNNTRITRASLRSGDVVRVGEVEMSVAFEEVS